MVGGLSMTMGSRCFRAPNQDVPALAAAATGYQAVAARALIDRLGGSADRAGLTARRMLTKSRCPPATPHDALRSHQHLPVISIWKRVTEPLAVVMVDTGLVSDDERH